MSRLTSKITVPIILVGLFSITVFVALNYGEINSGFYVVVCFLAVYIFSFGFAIGQKFASPINKLLENATQLSKGNLSGRVYLQTKDELSELAEVINKIAENLEENRIDSKVVERSVEIKTQARTKALEETINALEQKIRNRTAELEKMLNESRVLQKEVLQKEMEISQLKKEVEGPSIKKIEKASRKKDEKNTIPVV